MMIYLAGAIQGNLSPVWKVVAKLPNADAKRFASILNGGGFSDGVQINEALFSGGRALEKWGGYDPYIRQYRPYILESFYYVDADTERLLPYFGDFLLDSGAFTFMQNSKAAVNWDEYIKKYADFINRNKIEKFFELDIDSVVGYEKVLTFRATLEKLTGKRCIPVWHKSRGMDEFCKMCDEYEYAAIGGIVAGEIPSSQYKYLPNFIKEAHKRKCKLHGLGFTALQWLEKCHFDSVDSTAWTTGNRFGYLYKFNGKTMVKIDVPKGKRFAKEKSRDVALNNYLEWIKFQKYAETHF